MSEHVNLATLTAMFAAHQQSKRAPICGFCRCGWPCGAVTLGDAFLAAERKRLLAEQERDDARQAATAEAALVDLVAGERDALRAALARFGRHDPECAALTVPLIADPCDCGLRDAMEGQ